VSADPAFAAAIREKFLKSGQRVKRAESALEKAKFDHDELAVTMRTLIRHGLIEDEDSTGRDVPTAADMNEAQSVVLSFVPKGESAAASPKDIISELHNAGRDDLTADYIRTTLWRFAKRGALKSDNGMYWWPPAATKAEIVAAPDAETSEADNASAGPLGGERGFPPTTPEGSNPSGSTSSQYGGFNVPDDLDDDVPF
jgi:hypothetical protein